MGIYDRDYFRGRWSGGYGSGFARVGSVTKGLILANIAVFLIQWIARVSFGGGFVLLFGLHPEAVVHKLAVWQLATYMFLHGGFWHIFINMLVFYYFGMEIEAILGPRRFLRFYLLCGIVAGAASALFYYGRGTTIIGASGAVLGVLAAFATYFPNRVIQVWVMFILPIHIRAKYLALGVAVITLLAASSGQPGIANIAHLAGMLTGFLYVKYQGRFAYRSPFAWLKKFLRFCPRIRFKPPPERDQWTDEMVNQIIDKARSEGIGSLTSRERKFIKSLSRKRRK